MSNTSESPETQEQAKPATARSRTTRQKAESAIAGSQEQETKPATSRRSSSTTRSHTTKASAVTDEESLVGGLLLPMIGDDTDVGLEYLLVGPMLRGMRVGVSL